MAQKKKHRKVSKLGVYIVFSIGVTLIYTTVAIILACKGIELSDTLTACVYAFFGGEIVTAGLIKIFNIKVEGSTNTYFNNISLSEQEEQPYE